MTMQDEKEGVKDVRQYRLELKQCIIPACGGEVVELSYYERNNWATAEFQCKSCSRRFVVKAEI